MKIVSISFDDGTIYVLNSFSYYCFIYDDDIYEGLFWMKNELKIQLIFLFFQDKYLSSIIFINSYNVVIS